MGGTENLIFRHLSGLCIEDQNQDGVKNLHVEPHLLLLQREPPKVHRDIIH
jgi:hypothetical protein